MENNNPLIPQQNATVPYGNSNYYNTVRKRKKKRKLIFLCPIIYSSVCLQCCQYALYFSDFSVKWQSATHYQQLHL